mgnify:CR=1 FL=1
MVLHLSFYTSANKKRDDTERQCDTKGVTKGQHNEQDMTLPTAQTTLSYHPEYQSSAS